MLMHRNVDLNAVSLKENDCTYITMRYDETWIDIQESSDDCGVRQRGFLLLSALRKRGGSLASCTVHNIIDVYGPSRSSRIVRRAAFKVRRCLYVLRTIIINI
jgi:hypothetical protein